MPIYLPQTLVQNPALTVSGPTIESISFSIFDVNSQSPVKPLDLTAAGWSTGVVSLAIAGLGANDSFDDVIWRNAPTPPIVLAGNLVLAATFPNVTINFSPIINDLVDFLPPFFNFPAGEYMLTFYLQNSISNLQAVFKDILYITT
jgi:hypothetical protein